MSDPLSVTAAVLAITTAAIQSVQCLAKLIDDYENLPDSIKNIKSDLTAMAGVLEQLDATMKRKDHKIVLSEPTKLSISSCDRACTAFSSKLDHWMRHSTGDKTFWADRWRVVFFGTDRIKSFQSQLNDCKATLNAAISTSTYIMLANNESDREERNEMLKQREEALTRKVIAAKNEENETAKQVHSLSIQANSNQNSEQSQEMRNELLQLVEEMQRQLVTKQAYRRTVEENISQITYARTGHRIVGTHAKDHSKAAAGFIGTTDENFKSTLTVENTTAENYSIAAAGVVHGFDFSLP